MWVLEILTGVLVMSGSAAWGVYARLFYPHALFPLGFWLVSDGLEYRLSGLSLLRRWPLWVDMLPLGAFLGLALDFQMVAISGILEYVSVKGIPAAIALYLGWGLCLPAIYSSYRVFVLLLGRSRVLGLRILTVEAQRRTFPLLGATGAFLVAVPLFVKMYVGTWGPGVIAGFSGLWLFLEYVEHTRGRRGLLKAFLQGDWLPVLAMVIPASVLAIVWENLNLAMDSWTYRNLFWLEPKLLGVPLVAYFGYVFWFILFLSFYEAIRWRGRGTWQEGP
ncbi:MAG: hypothetical protein AB1566_02030 [Chloroflexota bacterium]